MKISFIIPIFKVEQYIHQCVDSILCQTYKDLEIILVDDGSPDNCPQICDEYSAKDCRVKALHKPNGGLSDARNAGLKAATGDYVVFVDGDDFWERATSLDQLMEIVEKTPECDFIGYNCQYYYPESSSIHKWLPFPETITTKAVNNNTAMIELAKSGIFPVSACLKIIKRCFLIDNNLFFIKGQLAEDIPWFINVLDKAKCCMFVNQYTYCYRQNVVGSITNSRSRRGFDNLMNIVKTEVSKADSRSFNEDAKKALLSFLAYEYCILLTSKSAGRADRKNLREYRYLLDYNLNPKVRMASKINSVFGYRFTTLALKTYMHLHKSKR